MMTDPKQPDDHPAPGSTAAIPPHAPNGVPTEAVGNDPAGQPSSDRHETETAASPEKHKK